MDNYNYWRTLEDFLISKREGIVLKRDAKITTQKIKQRNTPLPSWNKKKPWKAEGPKKNHPQQELTQSRKPTKDGRPFFMNNFISDQRK